LLAIAATCALAPMIFIMWFIKNVDLGSSQETIVPESERREGSETDEQVTGKAQSINNKV
jgi:hypothetical protein